MALTGTGLAKFAESKLGTPYVYGAKGADGKFTEAKLLSLSKSYPNVFTSEYKAKAKKFVGKVCCDCSGLISWYTGKVLGSAQLYQSASGRHKIDKTNYSGIPVGAVVWKEGHVGVYIGNGYIVEEMGISYGCVKTKLVSRTFTHWLTFSWMSYGDTVKTTVKPSSKATNPYSKPKGTVKRNDTGNSVKWVQYELKESGYSVDIDGEYGLKTFNAVKKFQQSCKITADGVAGPKTIAKLAAV